MGIYLLHTTSKKIIAIASPRTLDPSNPTNIPPLTKSDDAHHQRTIYGHATGKGAIGVVMGDVHQTHQLPPPPQGIGYNDIFIEKAHRGIIVVEYRPLQNIKLCDLEFEYLKICV